MTTMTMSLSRSVGSGTSNKDRKMPTFQQLAMIPSDSVDGRSTNPFHTEVSPTNSNEIDLNDVAMSKRSLPTHISSRRIGSGSRSQWSTINNKDTFVSFATRQGRSVAMMELDLALGDENDDGNDMIMASEASYDHSEETAVTGNVSSNSSTIMKNMVTPENSPGKGSRGRKGRRRDNGIRLDRQNRRSGTPDQKRKPFMCGAVGVNDELIGSIQDVNNTLSQIFTTVRRFGPKEKDAVRETLKDARYYMKEKVRAALLSRNKNDNCSGNRSPDRVSMDITPKRRGGTASELRENDSNRSTVHEVRRRERLAMQEVEEKEELLEDESEEVVYDKSGSEPEAKLTRMLV